MKYFWWHNYHYNYHYEIVLTGYVKSVLFYVNEKVLVQSKKSINLKFLECSTISIAVLSLGSLSLIKIAICPSCRHKSSTNIIQARFLSNPIMYPRTAHGRFPISLVKLDPKPLLCCDNLCLISSVYPIHVMLLFLRLTKK